MAQLVHIERCWGLGTVLRRVIPQRPLVAPIRRQPSRADQTAAASTETFSPPQTSTKHVKALPQPPFCSILSQNSGSTARVLESLGSKVTQGLDGLLRGLHILLWKGKRFKGRFIPSKWKWYHRHGYWATRKKLLKFDTYRRHRYHEVRGPGKRPPSKWEDQSFYKPLRDSIKFW
ncbi:hypothetical protein BaOVIS_016500 [Babesia ovis]|uniref:39S ribosomal protein L35, mitochondrial n=1 Tax=Babesia ovis TaxID=5869 RepID=A0A9W5TBC5_BABOV|nr:hypothetical protein BaOVIS_016500 [Babesia ovis]